MKIANIRNVKFGWMLLTPIQKIYFKIYMLFTCEGSKKKIQCVFVFFDKSNSIYKIKHGKVDNFNDTTQVESLGSLNRVYCELRCTK
jgi:hypothetical protein